MHARDYDVRAALARSRHADYTAERDLDSWRLYLLASRARLLAETGRWREAEAEAQSVLEQPPRHGGGQDSGADDARPAPRAAAAAGCRAICSTKRWRSRCPPASRSVSCPSAQRAPNSRGCRARAEAARAEADAGLAALTPTDSYWDRESAALPAVACRGAAGAAGGTDRRLLATRPARHEHARRVARGRRRVGAAWAVRTNAPKRWRTATSRRWKKRCRCSSRSAPRRPPIACGRTSGASASRGCNAGPRASTRAHPAGLTRRESEILALLALGLSNPAIGERLFVSPKTVEHHVSAILGKLEVATRDEAVAEARRRGWLTEPTAVRAK